MTLEELYDRYGVKMYHFLALRLGSEEDAEDVVQETFCRLARYSVRWAVVRNPGAFVFKVARNEADRFLSRKIGRRELERENHLQSSVDDPRFPGAVDRDGPAECFESGGQNLGAGAADGGETETRPAQCGAGPRSVQDDPPALLAHSLADLPDEQREVVVLKAVQDFTFREIAAICGLSVNTAASRYRYGIEKLRSRLEEKT